METVVIQAGPADWEAYGRIRSSFVVRSIFECERTDSGLGGIRLVERPVTEPYEKYRQHEGPSDWAEQFDLGTWGIFLAIRAGEAVGGAAVAAPSSGIIVTEGRTDVACLWDLRVSTEVRRRGVGTALVRRCANWARQQGFKVLAVETQNVNVPACRCYAQNGCELAEIRLHGYAGCPEVADEVMLIWHLVL